MVQHMGNCRVAAVRKLHDYIRNSGLSADVFPELQNAPEA
jgi:hypothetical protein